MTATAPSMLALNQLRAEYKSGQSALGHHWRIFGDGDDQIGRTKLAYQGAGGKIGKRLLVATGLSTAGSIEARIDSGDGDHVATVTREGKTPRTVALLELDGTRIGSATHTADIDIEFVDGSGTILGKIVTPPDTSVAEQDRAGMAYPIQDAAGTQIGEMARVRHPQGALPSLTGQLVSDALGLYNSSENAYEAELTRHRGFASSSVYSVVLDPAASIAEPLRTLAILSPVLAGYLY